MTYKVVRCLLRDLLRKNGMSQVDLAVKLGVTPQQVQHYVQTNRLMSIEVAMNIASILGCNIEDLYEWKKTK